ncbi:hypothetical protein OBV_11430 [Oscillibacter valericigenes Sjm18-20]|nr:hypothetical protein OBV_11430 [Oscillibacter valericigenes Sjm18-20]
MTVGNRDCSTGHVLPYYFNLLKLGLNHYKALCQEKLAETMVDCKEKQEQADFWNAAIMDIDAAEAFATRYSELAKKMAADKARRG